MKSLLFFITGAIGIPATLTAGHAASSYTEHPIHVNCYRGPFSAMIWDRPQGTFVQDLVDFGYDHANANAIAHMICSDANLVGNPERLKAVLLREMDKNPPATQRAR